MNRQRTTATRMTALAVLVPAALTLACLVAASPASAATVSGTVATGSGLLNVRSGPSYATALAGQLGSGTAVSIACQSNGAWVGGYVRATAAWDRLTNGRWVSDAYVNRTTAPVSCASLGTATPPAQPTPPAAPTPTQAPPAPTPAPVTATTATATTATVATGSGPLNVRSGPGYATALAGQLGNGAPLALACQSIGAWVTGYVRATAAWDRLTDGRWVSDGYVNRGSPPASCATSATDMAAAIAAARGSTWVRPIDSAALGGFRTTARPTHDGVDLMSARGTPIRAAGPGTVITAECNASTNNCDVDGSPQVLGCGWYVEIHHPGALVTRYCHLVTRPAVALNQTVTTGQIIGYVGTSGNSSGTHLHFEVHTGDPAVRANAIDPVPFLRGVGAPLAGT